MPDLVENLRDIEENRYAIFTFFHIVVINYFIVLTILCIYSMNRYSIVCLFQKPN